MLGLVRVPWIAVLVLACAVAEPEAITPIPPFEERLRPDWHPGDREPVAAVVARWGEAGPDVEERRCEPRPVAKDDTRMPTVDPFRGPARVVIRNRCGRPAIFVVGPDVAVPPIDAPLNRLAPGHAISTELGTAERVYLRGADGSYLGATAPHELIVFLGEPECSRVWHDD